MSAPETSTRRRVALATLSVALAAAVFDLTTSLLPSPADHLWPIPDKPGWLMALQAACAIPLAALLVRAAPSMRARWRALPVPAPAKWALAGWLAVATGHVALRAERYPFSPVTMFSSGVPEPRSETIEMEGYAVFYPDGAEAVSWLREGNPVFARHGFGFDYKAGWAMHMRAYGSSVLRDRVEAQLAEEGAPTPRRVSYQYRRADGRLVLPPGVAERP